MRSSTTESFLRRVPLFALLKRKDLEKISELFNETEYPPGTVIFHEGDRGDGIYIIAEGEVQIIKALGTENECVLRVCGSGEHVGEICFLNPDGLRSASMRTLKSTRLLVLAKEDFETLISRWPSLAFSIACGICNRFLDLENRLLSQLREKNRQLSSLLKMMVNSDRYDSFELQDLLAIRQETEYDEKGHPGLDAINIRTFGGFQVFRGESPIAEHEWKGNQPGLLLKAIITRGSLAVPKAVLVEDLWPEAPPRSGDLNFKVVLHYLRKTLEPRMSRKSSYIQLKGNLVSINKNLCRIDFDDFLSLCSKGRKAEEAGDLRRALLINNECIDLYKGDFLPEDIYASWATSKREELRNKFVDLLLRTADLYQALGTSRGAIKCYRRIMEIDPSCAECCQKLMTLYAQRGNCSMAIKVFEDYKMALALELDIEPDELTLSIYKKIAGNHDPSQKVILDARGRFSERS